MFRTLVSDLITIPGTVPEDLAIIFEDNPSTEYDGHFIYKQIPPPTPKG